MPNEGPTIRRRRAGMLLRQAREAARLSREQVGAELECSESKVARIENARRSASKRDVRDMLALYNASDELRSEVTDLMRGADQRGWWDEYAAILPGRYTTYIGLESEAATLRAFEPQVIPGLIQTEDYARALIRRTMPDVDQDEVEARVQARMTRQQVLSRIESRPLRLSAVVEEGVLRRVVGGPETMRAQQQRIIEAIRMPNIRVLVLPFWAGPAACIGPLALLGFRDSTDPPVGYVETAQGGLWIEQQDQVERCILIYDELIADALGPEDSVEFIASINYE